MAQATGMQTYRAILEQPAALQRVLERDQARLESLRDLADDADEVVFTGCGSSYHLATCAAAAFRGLTGRNARAVVASEVIQYPELALDGKGRTLLVAISRSGETTEALRAAEAFRDHAARHGGGNSLGVSCKPGSGLFVRTDHGLAVEHAGEEGLVMTRSFTALLMMLQLWAAEVGGAGYPSELSGIDGAVQRVLDRHAGVLRETASFLDLQEWVFLGAGPLHGLAWEGALKAREMAEQAAIAYHPLELRHGPRASFGPHTLAVLLRSERGTAYEDALVAELQDLGARVLVLTPGLEPRIRQEAWVDVGPYSDLARTLVYAPALQLLAYYRALAKGVDPDHPAHLTPVVEL